MYELGAFVAGFTTCLLLLSGFLAWAWFKYERPKGKR